MSRYLLSDFEWSIDGAVVDKRAAAKITDVETLQTTFSDWLSGGAFGWDHPLETYFLQGPKWPSGRPRFWYGTTFREIPSPRQLLALINRLFGHDDLTMPEPSGFIEQLKSDRNSVLFAFEEANGIRREVEAMFESMDEHWSTHLDTSSFSGAYISNGVFLEVE